ncbi:MAG: hypothetical protein L6R39_005331 [Caloplaca ligustica]|nr:MAG: hypothetical protein L6R39_005331 [Caloplaca ligustica]
MDNNSSSAGRHIREQARNFFAFTGVEAPPRDALFILVLGMTGSGKSSFIEQWTGKSTGVGHGLRSCTANMGIFDFRLDGRTVYLIDSPGFDDTHRDDLFNLRTLATCLSASFAANIGLAGIIFLHRISDNRMTGPARRNIEMFKAMCGSAFYPHIALGTTFWTATSQPHSTLCSREAQLLSEETFFAPIVRRGGVMFRHAEHGLLGAGHSARKIVRHLIQQMNERRPPPGPLRLQVELVHQGKRLDQTEAGKIVGASFAKVVAEMSQKVEGAKKEMQGALRMRNHKDVEKLNEKTAQIERDMKKTLEQRRQMEMPLGEMVDKERESFFQRVDQSEKRLHKELRALKGQLRQMEFELHRKARSEQRAAEVRAAKARSLACHTPESNLRPQASRQAPPGPAVASQRLAEAQKGQQFGPQASHRVPPAPVVASQRLAEAQKGQQFRPQASHRVPPAPVVKPLELAVAQTSKQIKETQDTLTTLLGGRDSLRRKIAEQAGPALVTGAPGLENE